MNPLKYINKGRTGLGLPMAVLVTILAFIVHFIVPDVGIELSMAGLVAILGLAILSIVTGGAMAVVEKGRNNLRDWKAFSTVAYIVLVVASLVTPLSNWVVSYLPF